MSKQKQNSFIENEQSIVRGPDAIAAAFGLTINADNRFEADVWRFERAITYFNIFVFTDKDSPWCVYQEDLEKISAESSRYVIRGMKAIAEALGYWTDETSIKRAQRAIKHYNLPVFKDKNQVCICRIDIDNLLIGRAPISEYLSISEKTLYRWIKKYPKIPIKNKHGIPCADKSQLFWWNELRIHAK